MTDLSSRPPPGLLEKVANPEFDKATKVHDWRNHVARHVKAIWHTFTPEQQMALAMDAEERASAEDWE